MEPSALQYTILRLLELHAAKGLAMGLYVVDIAFATHATLDDVQRQLEILRQRELVELIASGSSCAARLTYHRPRLRLIAGHLRCFHRLPSPGDAALASVADGLTRQEISGNASTCPVGEGWNERRRRVQQTARHNLQAVLELLVHS